MERKSKDENNGRFLVDTPTYLIKKYPMQSEKLKLLRFSVQVTQIKLNSVKLSDLSCWKHFRFTAPTIMLIFMFEEYSATQKSVVYSKCELKFSNVAYKSLSNFTRKNRMQIHQTVQMFSLESFI